MINPVNLIKYNNNYVNSSQLVAQSQIDSNNSVAISVYNCQPYPFYTSDFLDIFNADSEIKQIKKEQ